MVKIGEDDEKPSQHGKNPTTHRNIEPFSNNDCSHRNGLYALTSSRVTTETSYRVGFRFILADTRTFQTNRQRQRFQIFVR
jgi:hypothetical protein